LIEEFVDRHLSNWYVRLSRRKFWKGEMSMDKRAAYETLFECLNVAGQLMSPIAPFFSEWLYKNLTDGVREKAVHNKTPLAAPSVHLTLLTGAEENIIDKDLEERMDLAQNISSLVLSIRKKVNLKVRQPLQKILIPVSDKHIGEQVLRVKDLILSEVNVKELEFLADTSGFIKKKVKPNFKLLGQKLGKKMKQANEILASLPQQEILKLEKSGVIELEIDGEKIPITLAEVELISEDIPGWQVANEGDLTVALDVNVTGTLREEGYARELINRIQKLRKDLDFSVTDHIDVSIEKNNEINLSVLKFKNYICAEILADTLELVDSLDQGVSIDVNESPVKIIIKQKNSRDGKK
jgi:isoleucyl-tRNA synthetase